MHDWRTGSAAATGGAANNKANTPYTPFPPLPTLSKVDMALESGEYFLSNKEREARTREAKAAQQLQNKHAKKVERAAEFVAPAEPKRTPAASPSSTEPSVDALAAKFLAQSKVIDYCYLRACIVRACVLRVDMLVGVSARVSACNTKQVLYFVPWNLSLSLCECVGCCSLSIYVCMCVFADIVFGGAEAQGVRQHGE